MVTAIAWRNLWRNTRRTMLTVAAVGGGLALMIAMYGMIRAWGDRLVEGLTGTYVGHVQIHEEGFRSKRGTAKAITDADAVLAAVRSTPGVVAATGRIYGFAHAAFVRGTDAEVRGGEGEDVSAPVVSLLGVEPAHEAEVTDLAEKVVEGRWIRDRTDVVIGAALAKRVKVRVGDAFLPTAVDRSGATRGPWAVSDRVPRVVGIVRTGVVDLDDRMVFLSREYLSQLMNMEDQVHEVAIRSSGDPRALEPEVAAIRAAVAEARARAERDEPLPATRPLAVHAGDAPAPPDGTGGTADAAPPPAPPRLRLIGVEASLDGEARSASESRRLVSGTFIERSDQIVLSRSLARALSVSPGDRIEVTVPVECGEGVAPADCPPSFEPFVVAGVAEGEGLLDGRFGLVASSVLADNIAALAPGVMRELSDEQRAGAAGLLGDVRGAVRAQDEVLSWYELSPEVRDMLAMFDVAPMMMLAIVFIDLAMVIMNTLLMATFERTREIGLMRALGMGSGRVVAMVLAESFQLAIVGVIAGLIAGLGIVWYWSVFGLDVGVFMGERNSFDMAGVAIDPVMWPRLEPRDLLMTVIPVVIITTLSGLWPAIRAARLQPTEALRQD